MSFCRWMLRPEADVVESRMFPARLTPSECSATNHLQHEVDHLAVDDFKQVFSIDLIGHLVEVIEGVSDVADS
jgi:hypothetical protein